MKKFLRIILQHIVVAHMLSVSYGDSHCDCTCDLKEYGLKNICETVAGTKISVDENVEAVKALTTSYSREVLPFIKEHRSSDQKEEVEKLRNQFESKQRRLEEKIKILEKYFLETRDQLLENTENIEILEKYFLETRDQLLENTEKIEILEKYFLETRENKETIEILEKHFLETRDKLLGNTEKIEILEKKFLEKIDKLRELAMQMEKEDSELKEKLQAEQAHRSHLEKMLNETRDKLRKLDEAQNKTAVDLREEMAEGDRRNKTLEYLQAAMENSTEVGNRVGLYKEIFGVLLDTFQAMDRQVLPTTQELEKKSAHLEKVFRHVLCENVSAANAVVSSTMATVEGDQQDIFSTTTESVTSIQNEVKQCPPEISILNGSEATTETCYTPQSYAGVKPIKLYKGPLTVENCGNALLLDRNTKESNNRTEKSKADPFQFLVLVQRKLKNESEFKNHCWGVVLNDRMVLAKFYTEPPEAKYRVLGETEETGKFKIEAEITHPSYVGTYLLFLRLMTSVPFSTSVNFSPPCLLGEEIANRLFGPAHMLRWDFSAKYEDCPRASVSVAESCIVRKAECIRAYHYVKPSAYALCVKNDKLAGETCHCNHEKFLFKEIGGKEVFIGFSDWHRKDKPFLFYELYIPY